ncbi:hypothetical protein [uncultured Mediterranean phage]|nr:hypothetical protein [uncultured Mediterranean phage]
MPTNDYRCSDCEETNEHFYTAKEGPPKHCECGGALHWAPSGDARQVQINGDYWYDRVMTRARAGNRDSMETIKNIGYQLTRTPRDRHDLQKLEKESGSMRSKFGDDKPWI